MAILCIFLCVLCASVVTFLNHRGTEDTKSARREEISNALLHKSGQVGYLPSMQCEMRHQVHQRLNHGAESAFRMLRG